MKIAIIDYGMGNLGSVRRAVTELAGDCFIASAPEQLADATGVILPGVGGFGDAMINLERAHWPAAIRACAAQGKAVLGICLGMQLLAARGTEGGDVEGLGLIGGTIRRIDELGCGERVPHVGWNSVRIAGGAAAAFAGVPDRSDFYFVHSFAYGDIDAADVLGYVDYGVPLVAAVGRGRVLGMQFHPEKSSKAGFRVLRNFLELARC